MNCFYTKLKLMTSKLLCTSTNITLSKARQFTYTKTLRTIQSNQPNNTPLNNTNKTTLPPPKPTLSQQHQRHCNNPDPSKQHQDYPYNTKTTSTTAPSPTPQTLQHVTLVFFSCTLSFLKPTCTPFNV